MADKNLKLPENVPGAFYVDESCIDCDMCRTTAPDFFRRHDETGFTVVYRQPTSSAEMEKAEEALRDCPTESIGSDELPM